MHPATYYNIKKQKSGVKPLFIDKQTISIANALKTVDEMNGFLILF